MVFTVQQKRVQYHAKIAVYLRHNHFEAFPVDVEDLDAFIGFEVTTQLCDVDVHGTSVEIVRIAPNRFQGIGALKQIVAVLAQQEEQLVFLGRKPLFPSVFSSEHLCVVIELEGGYGNLTNVFFSVRQCSAASKNGLDTHQKLLHAERFGHVIIGTDLEPFKRVFLGGTSGKE